MLKFGSHRRRPKRVSEVTSVVLVAAVLVGGCALRQAPQAEPIDLAEFGAVVAGAPMKSNDIGSPLKFELAFNLDTPQAADLLNRFQRWCRQRGGIAPVGIVDEGHYGAIAAFRLADGPRDIAPSYSVRQESRICVDAKREWHLIGALTAHQVLSYDKSAPSQSEAWNRPHMRLYDGASAEVVARIGVEQQRNRIIEGFRRNWSGSPKGRDAETIRLLEEVVVGDLVSLGKVTSVRGHLVQVEVGANPGVNHQLHVGQLVWLPRSAIAAP